MICSLGQNFARLSKRVNPKAIPKGTGTWGQIFIFDYDYSQSPPTGDRQEQTPQLEYLCWFVKASYGVKHCGDSSDDYESHFFAMLSFEKCFNV